MSNNKQYNVGDIIVYMDRDFLQIISVVNGVNKFGYRCKVLTKCNERTMPTYFDCDSHFGKRCRKLDGASKRVIKCLFDNERQNNG